ncbi:MAG: FAD-dependent oxidoreductase [Candidatus Sericytochromatia bacterium]|nr:FAD-dependent oxidoreductase [Candidatus Sericytochromatia bacterium]
MSPSAPLDIVIVGNGAAGTTCAEHIRKLSPTARITLFGDETFPLYNRVALPPMLKERIPEARVMLRDLAWHDRMDISLELACRVNSIDREARTVLDDKGRTHRYDRLLLATGGRPLPLDLPGADKARNLYRFQDLLDTRRLMVDSQPGRTAVVCGGSFISYELAEALMERGCTVHWLIRGSHFLRRVLHPEGGAIVDEIARSHGVHMHYGVEIAALELEEDRCTRVRLTDGQVLECDLVALGIGLGLNTELAREAGLAVRKGIVVDGSLRTEDPAIYAAGDVAEFEDIWIGGPNLMGTWNNALGHGKVVARHMLGEEVSYEEIPEYTTGMFHQKMTAFGVTPESVPGVSSTWRANHEAESFRQLFFLEGRLVGGVLIGADTSERKAYKEIIRSREVHDAAAREALLDPRPKAASAGRG